MLSSFEVTFDRILQLFPRADLQQTTFEWREFLRFCLGYFRGEGILNPCVVEVGVYKGVQEAFYVELLGAQYISIDRDSKTHPVICGNSGLSTTRNKLMTLLRGRPIDLLFIDGDHSLTGVTKDYELYAPLTQHLVALHDVTAKGTPVEEGSYTFWERLKATNIHTLTIQGGWDHCPYNEYTHGIGIVVKEGRC